MRPRIGDRDLSALGLFPLPDVVLLPDGILPLKVFEPRYLQLTEDALAGDRLIAVPRLVPGYESEYLGRPALYAIAGVGEIIQSERGADGRYEIVLLGLGRVSIANELPPNLSYRQARARLLDDTSTRRPEALEPGREHLTALCDELARRLDRGGKELRSLVREDRTVAHLIDAMGSALVPDPDARQKLLETLDPADRIDLLNEYVAELLALVSPRSDMPN